MPKEWKEITDYFSEKRRHYNGKYMLVDYLLDDNIEVQLYKSEDDDDPEMKYEIFFIAPHFYGSTYPDTEPYKIVEAMKEDLYKESLKKKPFSDKFIGMFCKKYSIEIPFDAFFNFKLF